MRPMIAFIQPMNALMRPMIAFIQPMNALMRPMIAFIQPMNALMRPMIGPAFSPDPLFASIPRAQAIEPCSYGR
jgi:hypothetical protein